MPGSTKPLTELMLTKTHDTKLMSSLSAFCHKKLMHWHLKKHGCFWNMILSNIFLLEKKYMQIEFSLKDYFLMSCLTDDNHSDQFRIIMARFPFSTKLLSKPTLTSCQVDPQKQAQWNLNQNRVIFIQGNSFQNIGHFAQASICSAKRGNPVLFSMK